ncbi:MAG: class I SAM-dependent rRNA methyltransferase [Candidatus Omnitrophica bacterium]|nr:class I SAM-dependent rRNA methyltransferase [Candidatus Omnitrophota bacterium]
MQDKIIQLRKGRKGTLRPGHPWIYKGQLPKDIRFIRPGEIVSVVDSEGKLAGKGYYNSKSEIVVRFLTFQDEAVNDAFLHKRIEEAFKKRETLRAATNAYRVIYSEADGLPGLIADLYDDTLVFQALTLGMDKLKGVIVPAMKKIIQPKYILERSESIYRKMEGLKEMTGWIGAEGPSIIEIREGKVRFLVDVVAGHKTGFYLDQRRSRMAMDGLSKGKRVLDLFCYTGGFSIWAAASGASHVTGVDIKEPWLGLARQNAELNGAGDRTDFRKGDAFETLRAFYKKGEKFDIIIVDPPSFAKARGSVSSASRGYKDLNLIAMKTLAEGGVLATFSCSHNISNDIFSGILKRAASDAKKRFDILKRCHQAQDHPIARQIPETEYLKGYFLKVYSI